MKPLNQLSTTLRSAWLRFRRWVALWPDSWAEIIGIFLFILSAPIFAWMADKFSGPEASILQNLLIVALEIPFINALAFLGILLNFTVIFDWYKKKPTFNKDWFSLSPWQRVATFLIIYVSFFLAGVLLVSSLQ